MLLAMFLFGMILMTAATDYIRDQKADPANLTIQMLSEWYGDVPTTLFSLLLAISGGKDWYVLAEPFSEISLIYLILFTIFVLFVMFGMLNILVGIFVEKAEELSHIDQELVIQEEMARNSSYLNQIKELFVEVDSDNSGTLTWAELNRNLQDQKVMAYFSLLGVDVGEAKGLFQLLDQDESGEVGIDEFIMGCMRLKGTAKSIDLATMLYENKRMTKKFNTFFNDTNERLGKIMKVISALEVLAAQDPVRVGP